MNAEHLGIVWLIVAVPLATIGVVYYAIRGWKRDQRLIALGETYEREQWIRDEQERMIRR